MRFRVLLSILCVSFTSTLVGVHVSAPYVRIGMIHVCTSLHIADISFVLNSVFPARLNMVWRAASTFPLVFLRWFVRFPLLLIVIPRYWYVSVLSVCVFSIVSTWLFYLPNLMWYLVAISSVMSNILWSSSLSWWTRATSSIHSRHPFILLFHACWFPTFLDFSSFAISSMRLAYSITDNTPPCLMPSFIFIVLLPLCLVRILAFRLLFSSFTILQFFPVRLFLWVT